MVQVFQPAPSAQCPTALPLQATGRITHRLPTSPRPPPLLVSMSPCLLVCLMKRWALPQLLLTLAAGAALWAIVALACLCVGSTQSIGWPPNHDVLSIRRETVLLASLIGAALGAAGVTYQAIL